MLEDTLNKVFNEAIKEHTYILDEKQYGVPDYWKPSLKGDCEDFSLWCREKLLLDYGIESDLVICVTETDEYHCVCSVSGWILDNRMKKVKNRDDMINYKWLFIGKPDGKWFEITK